MSKCAIIEAVYDGMVSRGLSTDHEAFEDILMACGEVAAMADPHGTDVIQWVVQKEESFAVERLLSQDETQPRTATQVYLDWREYLNKCSKKSMKLAALLSALVEEGAASAH